MAIPSFVNAGAFASGTGAISVAPPSGIAEGNLLLLFVESANQAIATPSGWTELTNSPQGTGTAGAAGGVRLAVFRKFAGSSEGSVSVADSGDHTTGVMLAYSGVDDATPINVTAGSVQASAATAWTAPAVTTSVADTLIVIGVGNDRDLNSTTSISAFSNANLSNLTKRFDQTTNTSQGGGLAVIDGGKATAGSTGTTSITNAASNTAAFLTIALVGLGDLTGTLAAQEDGQDTLSASGEVLAPLEPIEGTVAAVEEGQDAFAALGSIFPFQADAFQQDAFNREVPNFVTGDLAATEAGNDTMAAAGAVAVRGAFAASEQGADTLAGAGSVLVAGSLSAVESGADAFAGVGRVLVAGALSATESGLDTFSASAGGVVTVAGSMAATEAGDDAAAGVGSVLVSGALAATESGSDAAAFSGAVRVAGSLGAVETGADTFAASAGAQTQISGYLAADESGPDTAAVAGVVLVAGAMVATEEGADTAQFLGPDVQPVAARGYEMAVREVRHKRLIDRVLEARAERIKPAQKRARKRARVIEVQAAEIARSGNEAQFYALMQQWLDQKPQLPDAPGIDLEQLFMAQVAMQLQRIEQARRLFEQDEEEALIALLLA